MLFYNKIGIQPFLGAITASIIGIVILGKNIIPVNLNSRLSCIIYILINAVVDGSIYIINI